MRFSQDFIEKVRDANNIVEIIGQHTELKPMGHRLMGRCPFPDHNDKSPSFSVTEDNQLYHCYGCKKGGNVYTFLQQYNGMNFPEAVEHLARRASIPLPEPEDAAQKARFEQARNQKDLLLRVNKLAARFYYQQLKGLEEDHPARLYLQKRGLSEETVEKFRLGFSSNEWQGLFNHLRDRKVPVQLSESLGLIKPKKSGSAARPHDSHFDLFRDRLIFPIFSPNEDVIGFGGRTLGDGLPKYLNSSDSPVFNKSRVLYGLHETGKFIRAQDAAIVVEGYMDAIALYTAGIKNVVAILGTAFTPDHAKILKRYTLNVTMLLDGDEAGINAAERSLPILLESGMMPKGLLLPDKMDPDDFVKANGAEKLQAEIERAPELFTLLLSRRWMSNYHGSPSEKVRIIDEAAAVLKGMPNLQLRDLYMLEMSRQLDVDLNWLRRALQQAAQALAQKTPPPPAAAQAPIAPKNNPPPVEASEPREKPEAGPISLKGVPRDEAFVLSLLVQSEALLREFIESDPESTVQVFVHEGVRKTLLLAVELYSQRPGSFSSLASDLVSRVDRPEVITSALSLIPDLSSNEKSERAFKIMNDYMRAIRKNFYKRQARQLAAKLDQANPENLEHMLEELRDLHKLISEEQDAEKE